MHDTLIKNC